MFTPTSYRELIGLLKSEGYSFALFNDHGRPNDKVVFLRHDVDYTPRWAAEFGLIDRELGVTATFCFQLRSPLYNLASPTTLREIDTIIAQGHRVGFHFAFMKPPVLDNAVLSNLVRRDFEVAQAAVPTMVPWFSWHNPGLHEGLLERCLDLEVPGMVNLYSRKWIRETIYKSDSNWRYTIDEWHAIARKGHRRLQLLFHPFQWIAEGRDMSDVLVKTMVEAIRSSGEEFGINAVWSSTRGRGVEPGTLVAIDAALRLGQR